jgi:membrane-bound inhibitor of C-type lysozyme
MIRYKKIVIGAAIAAILVPRAASLAQTTSFRTYHCADGSQFIVAFYPYDPNAYLQIDGGSIMLPKRVSISGTRYSARGITLRLSRAGRITVKRPKLPETACDLM